MKYSSFLLTASILFFIVLCVSAADADADLFSRSMDILLQELSNIDQSSNVFVKYFRDMIEQQFGTFEKCKKLIQDAVTKGTEMEKRIQTISITLKNSNKPLPTKLQSELEEIGTRSAAELKKIKGVENAKEIDEMKKKFKEKYEVFRGELQELAKWSLELRRTKIKTEKVEENNKANLEKFKTEGIKFIQSLTSFLFAAENHSKTISDKHKVASKAFAMIRNDFIKVKQMEYHLLKSQKDHKKKMPLLRFIRHWHSLFLQ